MASVFKDHRLSVCKKYASLKASFRPHGIVFHPPILKTAVREGVDFYFILLAG